MNREQVLEKLKRHTAELKRYNVQSVALFGSFARAESKPYSDVDLLVEFSAPVGLLRFASLKSYLEELLERPVDLVTRDALKGSMREQILREALYAD